MSPIFSGVNLGSNEMDSTLGSTDTSNISNSHSYLSSTTYPPQDQYSLPTSQGQYDLNFSGWNSGSTSRGSPIPSNSMMEHSQISRNNSDVGSLSQNQSSHNHSMGMLSQDWQGQGQNQGQSQGHSQGQMRNSHDSMSMPFMHQHQMNYISGNDFNHNHQNNGNVMGMNMNPAANRSNNRFASSQMSQMGGGHGSGNRNFSPGATGTGGSNAQGRALNKMLLEILRYGLALHSKMHRHLISHSYIR